MSHKVTAALVVLIALGPASIVLADRTHHRGLSGQFPVLMSNDRTRAILEVASPFIAEEKAWSAASPSAPVRSIPRRDGMAGGTMIWIKLTEPGGKPIHINVEQVTAVRPDTQVPGAQSQLDLASGKFQGVREDAEQVMKLISATSSPRENDETVAER